MKKVQLELTNEEYEALMEVLKKFGLRILRMIFDQKSGSTMENT